MSKVVFMVTLLHLMGLSVSGQLKVQQLLIENLSNPIGIDAQKPRFSWQLVSTQRNVMQMAYEIKLVSDKKQVWTSGKVSSGQSVHVPYGGTALYSGHRYTWQVRAWDNKGNVAPWSAPASFQTGLLHPGDWTAKWIEADWEEDSIKHPPQYFRREFSAGKKVSNATLYITSHGLYEAYINGKRVGQSYFTPGWTSYEKRLQYQTYDVTVLLANGANTLGVVVGNGWYRGFRGWSEKEKRKRLGLLCQLQITFTDGSSETIISDDAWKSSTGPILFSEIYHGETYDARLEEKDWHQASYDARNWRGVKVCSYAKTNLLATRNEPVRKHETFSPVKIFVSPKGEQIIDFGQNLTGWVMMKTSGRAGDEISIEHAEVLDKHGNFYTENLRAAKATAKYILKGNAEELLEPHFTFFGFRYIRVKGFRGEIRPEHFTAVALYSASTGIGNFTSSSALINQLQHNIQWGQRGNFLDVPTDCPQRDERLGWTGDAQIFSRTAAFNFNVNSFFAKWLSDLSADQIDGNVPYVVPNVLDSNEAGAAGWADAATIIPWNMYLAYGDKQILMDQYASMKAWVDFAERNSKDYLYNNKNYQFGDWLFFRPFDDLDGSSAVTDKTLIGQCFFAHSTELLIKAANVLQKPADVVKYTELHKKIKEVFLKEFVTPGGRLVSGTQTAYVLALQFNLLPEHLRNGAVLKLLENIKAYWNHLTTGFLGTSYLCHVLSRYNHADVAYTLLLKENYPSWLYPVKMGATTIWERWDGIKPDSSFQTPSMNSFNHYAYGAIGDWLYRVAAGLDTDEAAPGYKKIIIRPHLSTHFTNMAVSLDSYYGKISSSWKWADEKLIMEVLVPPNTTATVHLPVTNMEAVTERGNAINKLSGLQIRPADIKWTEVGIGSGTYRFEMPRSVIVNL